MAYIMKGNPKDNGTIIGTESNKKLVETGNTDIHWNTGAVNTTGTKVVNEQGDWVSTDSVAGKNLLDKYSSTTYSTSIQTPTGDLANLPIEEIKDK